MKLFLDTAITSDIAERMSTGCISGVTTNPSLIKKADKDPDEVYEYIIRHLGIDDLSIEVDGITADTLIQNGINYGKLYPYNATIKLPCTRDGIEACKVLSNMGIPVNMTLVFSTAQAILCSLAGATYISPFVGRLDDNGHDGIGLIRDIAKVFCHQRSETKILAASIRNVQSVAQAFAAGAHICTIPPKVFDKMFNHVLTDIGYERFLLDSGQISLNFDENV